MSRVDKILDYFDDLIIDPKCELVYNKDYELVIAVMLSAQCTDKRVNMVTKELFRRYDSLEKLSNADIKDIEYIIRPVGSYTKKAKAIKSISCDLINKYDGKTPSNRKDLESLEMVGRKSANVILSEIYNIPSMAVDTHVDRISKRLYLAKDNDNVLEIEKKLKRKIPKDRWIKFHHQAVLFGRYYCMAKKPKCDNCKLINDCRWSKYANKNK